MRILVDRWYLGPIVAMAAIYGCVVAAFDAAQVRCAEMARQNLDRTYTLAREGRFDQMRREGVISEASVRYLEMQERCFGRVRSWDSGLISAGNGARNVWCTSTRVVRRLVTLNEVAAGADPHSVRIGLDPEESDVRYDPGPETDPRFQVWLNNLGDEFPPAPMEGEGAPAYYGQLSAMPTAESALENARPIIHNLDVQDTILPPLSVTDAGDYWVVVENTSSLQLGMQPRYLVLAKSGSAIERVRGPSRLVQGVARP